MKKRRRDQERAILRGQTGMDAPPPPHPPAPLYRLSLILLTLLALALRLWRLGAINDLVFDEIYYVEYARQYLQGLPVFDAHPPLGKYFIAFGIALLQPLATLLSWASNDLAGASLSPLSYRWINAVVGATLPLLVALLAAELVPTRRQGQRFALLAGGLMLLEGYTLVESRLGLINIYWVVLGVLGQLGLMRPSWRWRLVGGIALGAAVAVKWNGAGFWLGAMVFWGMARWRAELRSVPLARLTLRQLLGYGCAVPLLTYWLLWQPHLLPGEGVWAVHQQLWQLHQGIDSDAHPYCSRWYTWPLLLRPVAYYFQSMFQAVETPAQLQVTTIHGMGNPAGWWLGTAAVVALAGQSLGRLRGVLLPVPTYLLVNFAASWLPWAVVGRCTFLYLYLGALVFAQLGLAWLMGDWLRQGWWRATALMALVVVAGFWFWWPLFVGSPLPEWGFEQRMWLRSWI